MASSDIDKKRMIEEYEKEYARGGCNCLCWGYCCLKLWIIVAIIYGIITYQVLSDIEADYITLRDYDYGCQDANGHIYDVCCYDEDGSGDVYENVSCEEIETIYWIKIVACIIQAIVAVIGRFALVRLNLQFLKIPIGWTLISIGVIIYDVIKFDDKQLLYASWSVFLVLAILGTNYYTVRFSVYIYIFPQQRIFSFLLLFTLTIIVVIQ